MKRLFVTCISFFVILQSFAQTDAGEKLQSEGMESKNDKLELTEKEWQEKLSSDVFQVLRKKGTERAFTGKYDVFFDPGDYHCAGCGSRLFASDTKYNSGCGWPAFYDVEKGAVTFKRDESHGMVRVEVLCAKCDGHLGHVFEDGPRDKTGLRFCINSLALKFRPKGEIKTEKNYKEKD